MKRDHSDYFYPADIKVTDQDIKNELHKLLYDADYFLGEFIEALNDIAEALRTD